MKYFETVCCSESANINLEKQNRDHLLSRRAVRHTWLFFCLRLWHENSDQKETDERAKICKRPCGFEREHIRLKWEPGTIHKSDRDWQSQAWGQRSRDGRRSLATCCWSRVDRDLMLIISKCQWLGRERHAFDWLNYVLFLDLCFLIQIHLLIWGATRRLNWTWS